MDKIIQVTPVKLVTALKQEEEDLEVISVSPTILSTTSEEETEDTITVVPVTLVNNESEEVEDNVNLLSIDPDIISIINQEPAIEVDADAVAKSISVIELIQDLIDNTEKVTTYAEFLAVIREVLLRFDTDPKKYRKEDYLKLVLALVACFKYLYNQDPSLWFVSEWPDEDTDSKAPTEKLVKTALDAIDAKLTWIGTTDETVNFINIASDEELYSTYKTLYPNAVIFYLDSEKWVIYANGSEFNFNNLPEFIDAKDRILQLEEKIETVLSKENINLDSKDNGAYLTFPEGGKLQVKLDLATLTSNGALSATDKIKLDSLGWVSF